MYGRFRIGHQKPDENRLGVVGEGGLNLEETKKRKKKKVVQVLAE
jgi:hypothetical protein